MDAPAPGPDFDAFEASLLARIAGERRAVGANNPFLATAPGRVWLILRGRLDVSLVPMRDGEVAGVGRHLLSLDHGQVLFGMPPVPAGEEGLSLGLRVVAAMDSELFEAPRADLERTEFDLIAVDWIEAWVERLSAALGAGLAMPEHEPIEADPDQPMPRAVTAPHGTVLWARIESGGARLFGQEEAPVAAGDPPVALTDRSWLVPQGASVVSALLTPTALARGLLWPALDRFHGTALRLLRAGREREAAARLARAGARATAERRGFGAALGRIASVLRRPEALPGHAAPDPALAAAQLVAAAAGIAFDPPRAAADLADALRRTGLRQREVRLAGAWWQAEPGPLLGFRADGACVALLPDGPGGMVLHDPATGRRHRIDARVAAELEPRATMLYRRLPAGRLSTGDLLAFARHGLLPDLRRLLAMAVLGGAISLAAPLAISHLFGKVLPRGDAAGVVAVIVGLVLVAFGAAVFEAVRGIALLRAESRVDGSLQGAIWDRVLRMPPGFFRAYSVGDLTDRANSINAMREMLTATATQALLGGVMSVFSLVLLFHYAWKPALLALLLIALLGLATWALTRRQLPELRAKLDAQGRVEGLVLQLLAGMAKLRNSGAERRAFGRWAEAFATQQRHTWRARRWQAAQLTLNQAFPPLAAIALFWLAAPKDGAAIMDSAAFGGFHAAFGQLSAAMLALAGSLGTLAGIAPLYDRIRPLLEAEPEASEAAADPGRLTGAIELRHVTFRYAAGAPPVLDDISLSIRAGDFIAVVGASGSGKSTLVRLLLGFERPQAGGIAFDGRDQSGMDLGALRRQIGVVLQDGRLMSGSILENILAGAVLTQEQAWAALRLAGLEADVRAMPMGLQTVVSEDAPTLSGGQRQRLLIARALARSPRILVFDEATSALDNRTQAMVNQSLERLNVTRIVVAHRLSTIVNAHRIIVLDRGRIVESGSFKSLLAAGGLFAAMARRQMP
jgi:ATP-binding cassette subfamily C protein